MGRNTALFSSTYLLILNLLPTSIIVVIGMMPNFNSIKHWIAAHRLQTAFHVAMSGVVLRPDVVSAAMLNLPGFGKLGIRKGQFSKHTFSADKNVISRRHA